MDPETIVFCVYTASIVICPIFVAILSYKYTTGYRHKKSLFIQDKEVIEKLCGDCDKLQSLANDAIKLRLYYYRDYYCFQLIHTVSGALGVILNACSLCMIWMERASHIVNFVISMTGFVCVVIAIFILPEKRMRGFYKAWNEMDIAVNRIKGFLESEKKSTGKDDLILEVMEHISKARDMVHESTV